MDASECQPRGGTIVLWNLQTDLSVHTRSVRRPEVFSQTVRSGLGISGNLGGTMTLVSYLHEPLHRAARFLQFSAL